MIRTLGLALCLVWAGLSPAHADLAAGLKAYAEKDYDAALAHFSAEAEKNSADAQWFAGNMVLNGLGVEEPNPVRAARYYRQAADRNYAEAQLSLATLYRLGRGVPQDHRAAVDLLYKAAAQKHPIAQMDLGDLFLNGVPDAVDAAPAHARDWYRLAAKAGIVLAQFKVAQLYIDGKDMSLDPETGMAWLIIAKEAADDARESGWSKRVMALDSVVETDKDRRTLRAIIQAEYARYKESLPKDVVIRAEARARAYDRESF